MEVKCTTIELPKAKYDATNKPIVKKIGLATYPRLDALHLFTQ